MFFVPPFFFVKFVRYLECCLGDLFGNSILVVFCCTELIVCVLCDDLMMQHLELVRPLRKTICGISMWWSLAQLSRLMKVVMNLTAWFLSWNAWWFVVSTRNEEIISSFWHFLWTIMRYNRTIECTLRTFLKGWLSYFYHENFVFISVVILAILCYTWPGYKYDSHPFRKVTSLSQSEWWSGNWSIMPYCYNR